MKIYLIRHGETSGDLENKYGGTYNDHLTKNGEKQAQELAESLSELGIEKIFSSPYFRAKETATIIKNKLNVDFEVIEDFRERNHYGFLSGINKDEAKVKFPQEVEKVKSYLTCAKDGEEYTPFKERVEKAFNKVTKSNFNTIAIVTHGGVIREFFREVLKFGEINFVDKAYAVINFQNGNYQLLETHSISKQSIEIS